jgi:AcrR family transcriptional regulator
MAGIRERARAETTAEIVRLARAQVAEQGAAALSLRAIARDLGMVSSAIYRYFASRDELLTRLIIESYDRLGEATKAADAAVRHRTDHAARWRAVARGIREWALANPAEYALLFGTPVPGYAAPQDTIGPASRYTAVLLELLADIHAVEGSPKGAVPARLRADLERLRATLDLRVGDVLLARGMVAWANLMGAISLELFGHLHNVVDTPGALFDNGGGGAGRASVRGNRLAADVETDMNRRSFLFALLGAPTRRFVAACGSDDDPAASRCTPGPPGPTMSCCASRTRAVSSPPTPTSPACPTCSSPVTGGCSLPARSPRSTPARW